MSWSVARSGSDTKIAPIAAPRASAATASDPTEDGLEVAAVGDDRYRTGKRCSWVAGGVGGHGGLLHARPCHARGRIVHQPFRPATVIETLTGVCRAVDTPRVKLVVAIVHNEDAGALVNALLDKEFRATRLHSSGGFLKQSNATIILGVEDADVDEVISVVRANCTSRTQVVNPMPPIMEPGEFFMPYPLEVEVGGATVFVLPVERFERL